MVLGCYPSYSIHFKTIFFVLITLFLPPGGESVNTDFRKEFKQHFKISNPGNYTYGANHFVVYTNIGL